MKIDYYAYRSRMRDWSPEWKVGMAVMTLFLVILLNRILVSVFVVLTMGALTLVVGKTPFRVYRHYMMVPFAFMVLSCAAIAIQIGTKEADGWKFFAGWFYLGVTRDSLCLAAEVFCKALAGMSALYMMSFSTPMNEFILVLQRAHLPRVLSELMNLVYRYIFILFDVAQDMQTAAKARLGYRSFLQSCRSFAAIGGSLFLVSLKKANAYYDALLARGYDGRLEFLTEEKPVRGWQIGLGILYGMALILLGLLH
jgi:cobalt/nickel transport system permease protein